MVKRLPFVALLALIIVAMSVAVAEARGAGRGGGFKGGGLRASGGLPTINIGAGSRGGLNGWRSTSAVRPASTAHTPRVMVRPAFAGFARSAGLRHGRGHRVGWRSRPGYGAYPFYPVYPTYDDARYAGACEQTSMLVSNGAADQQVVVTRCY